MNYKESYIIIKQNFHYGLYEKNSLKWIKWLKFKDKDNFKKLGVEIIE